jgi:hypothetical protein
MIAPFIVPATSVPPRWIGSEKFSACPFSGIPFYFSTQQETRCFVALSTPLLIHHPSLTVLN